MLEREKTMLTMKSLSENPVQCVEHSVIPHIEQEAEQLHYRLMRVDCAQVKNKTQLLSAIAHQLAFSTHFGANFDALYDCLTDMQPDDAKGMLLVLRHLPVRSGLKQKDAEILLEILDDVAAFFAQRQIPYYVVYDVAEK